MGDEGEQNTQANMDHISKNIHIPIVIISYEVDGLQWIILIIVYNR